MPFDGVQGKEEALANFTIRTPLGNELQYLVLSFAQCLTKRMGRARGPASDDPNLLRVSDWLDERPRAETRYPTFERLYRMVA